MKGRKWVLVKPFDGLPKRSDLEVVEFEVPEIQDGGKLSLNFIEVLKITCNISLFFLSAFFPIFLFVSTFSLIIHKIM